jgi:cell division transport system permease protein
VKRGWVTFTRVCRYGLSNFWRNAWLSTAATAVMVLTLTVMLATFMVRLAFDDTVTQIREKIDISVYLKDNITQSQLNKLKSALKAVPIVTTIDYVSKEQAREIFKVQNKSDYDNLLALGELGDLNPFPASLKVHVNDVNKLDEIVTVISKPEFTVVQSDKSSILGPRKVAIDTIVRVASFSEVVGMIATGVFLVLSIMIIFNTIRMAIFNRRDEIEIMRLIGANKSFIRGPFIVEASLYGIFAALVSVGAVSGLMVFASPYLQSYGIQTSSISGMLAGLWWLLLLAQMGVGLMIGVVSSLLAMRRYLKV